ncbi:MAG: hypothetical protein RTU92_11205 [Candidatus Thorarchaeota archaeon]
MMGIVYIAIELALLLVAALLVLKLDVFTRHRRTALSVFLIAITFCFFLIQAPGVNGYDPGNNIGEFNTRNTLSLSYTVEPAPWFTPSVRIQCSYRMTVVEVTTVTISFYEEGALIGSTSVEIDSSSYEVKTEYGYGSINIAPGDYTVQASVDTGRGVDVELTQVQAEGRDEFQIAYDTFRQYALLGAIFLPLIFYCNRDRRIEILDGPSTPPASTVDWG